MERRSFLALAGAAALAPLAPRRLFAALQSEVPLHGLSAFGDLKYPADFPHFDYASPEAPEGGTFVFSVPNWAYNQNPLTFNTLNTFVPKGDAPPRMELCFDSLMTRALDEPDALYGLIAESVTLGADRRSYRFRLRPEARFHDGTPLKAEDVAFSYQTFKDKGHPALMLPLRFLERAEATAPHEVTLVFDGQHTERTILSVAEFPIISKAFFTENPFDGSQMKAPLGSGPYKVGRVSAGLSIEYEKVADYWGRDLAVNRGLSHFARIRIDFYRERQAGFEAFKKGDVLYRQEFTSKTWATEYDFPALRDGKVIKRTFPSELRPSLQAWAINQRRPRFQDVRVRQAIGLCFDFEWTRRNLFYDSYTRSESLFQRSDFVADGMPTPEELAILEPLRGTIPDEAFGKAVTQPVSDGSGRDRKLLGLASKLLTEAGWKRENGQMRREGERLTLEMLVEDPVFVRVDTPFIENMRAIGIDASIRMVDSTQYQARQADFDFDMIAMAASFTAAPTIDQLENYFSSRSATLPGSRNLTGVADPALDRLLAAVGAAKDRASLTVAMRALDRVLRARRDWIPNWYSENHRAAFWDMFGFKEPKPDYGFPVEQLWWVDQAKATAIGKG